MSLSILNTFLSFSWASPSSFSKVKKELYNLSALANLSDENQRDKIQEMIQAHLSEIIDSQDQELHDSLYILAKRVSEVDSNLSKQWGKLSIFSGSKGQKPSLNEASVEQKNISIPKRIDDELLDPIYQLIDDGAAEQTIRNACTLALLQASEKGRIDTVQSLRSIKEFEIELVNQDGRNALHIAASCGQNEMVLFLIKEMKISKDSVDSNGMNALHFAGINRQYETVRFLINEMKFESTSVCDQGLAVLDIAIMDDNVELINSILGQKVVNDRATHVLYQFLEWLWGSIGEKSLNPKLFFQIFGNYFGLHGKYQSQVLQVTKKSIPLTFNGMIPNLCRIVFEDILNYLPLSSLNIQVRKKIETMCQHVYVSHMQEGQEARNEAAGRLFTLLNKETPISIVTGWSGHGVNITMNKDFLFFINKGERGKNIPGMRKFKITKALTPEILSTILGYHARPDLPADEEQSSLEKILGLELEESYEITDQKVGNCGIANTASCLKAALMLLGHSAEEARQEHKNCVHISRLSWLEIIFMLIDKQEVDENLKTEFYFTLLNLTLKLAIKNKKSDLNDFDREILIVIKQKIESLLVLEDHPYLNKINELMSEPSKYDDSTKLFDHHIPAYVEGYNVFQRRYSAPSQPNNMLSWLKSFF